MQDVLTALQAINDFEAVPTSTVGQLDFHSPTRAQYAIADYYNTVLNDFKSKPFVASVSLGLLVLLFSGLYLKIPKRK